MRRSYRGTRADLCSFATRPKDGLSKELFPLASSALRREFPEYTPELTNSRTGSLRMPIRKLSSPLEHGHGCLNSMLKTLAFNVKINYDVGLRGLPCPCLNRCLLYDIRSVRCLSDAWESDLTE